MSESETQESTKINNTTIPKKSIANGLEKYQFKKGQSGNISGRPKGYKEFSSHCREHATEAMDVLLDILRTSDNEKNKMWVAKFVIERGYGTATQNVDIEQKTNSVSSVVIALPKQDGSYSEIFNNDIIDAEHLDKEDPTPGGVNYDDFVIFRPEDE